MLHPPPSRNRLRCPLVSRGWPCRDGGGGGSQGTTARRAIAYPAGANTAQTCLCMRSLNACACDFGPLGDTPPPPPPHSSETVSSIRREVVATQRRVSPPMRWVLRSAREHLGTVVREWPFGRHSGIRREALRPKGRACIQLCQCERRRGSVVAGWVFRSCSQMGLRSRLACFFLCLQYSATPICTHWIRKTCRP